MEFLPQAEVDITAVSLAPFVFDSLSIALYFHDAVVVVPAAAAAALFHIALGRPAGLVR